MKAYLLLSINLFLIFSISAQGLQDNQLKVKKQFKTELYTAKPIHVPLAIPVIVNSSSIQSNDSLQLLSSYTPELGLSVSPISYTNVSREPLHHAYVALHKGTINTWRMDAGAIYRAENHYTIGANVTWDKWNQTTVTDKFSNQTNINLSGKYYLSDKLLGRLSYEHGRQNLGLYAHNADQQSSAHDTLLMTTNKLSLSIENFSFEQPDWQCSLGADIIHTQHKLDNSTKEIWYKAGGSISKSFGSSWSVANNTQADFIRLSQKVSLVNNNTYLRYNSKILSSAIGFSFNAHLSNNKSIYPYLQLNWHAGNNTTVNLLVKEDYSANALTNSLTLNPYLNSADLSSGIVSRIRMHSASLATAITPDASIKVNGTYEKQKNAQNWIGQSEEKRLQVNTVDYSTIRTEVTLGYKINTYVRAELSGTYRHFMTDQTLFHRPTWTIVPGIYLNLKDDRITASLTGKINGKQNLSLVDDQLTKSNIRKDISAHIAYRPLKNLSIYLNADNVLADDYDVFSGYQVFSRNLSLGILLKL